MSDAWVEPTGESDFMQMVRHLTIIEALLAKMPLSELGDVLTRNQNAGCGGDGTMSEKQWVAAKDVALKLQSLQVLCHKVPYEGGLPIREEHRLGQSFTKEEMEIF